MKIFSLNSGRQKIRMKKILFIPVLLFLIGCGEQTTVTYFTADKAMSYFSSIEEICNRDNGSLWGRNLYGPIMFVERGSRRIVANQPDKEGLLKLKDGIYTAFYPKEKILNHAPVMYGGTLFAMVPLPAEEDEFRIRSRAVHVLFHVHQKLNGSEYVTFNQRNMDENEARLWIKLEWKALKKALNSTGEERLMSIRDALVFRGSNRELYQKYAADEDHFETYEGFASFTYIKLCTGSDEEFTSRLMETLDRIYAMSSYARSYGSIHGALYAALLYDAGYDLKTLSVNSTDLGYITKELYNIELPEICRDVAGSLALNYELAVINKEEEERRLNIQKRLHSLTSTFTEKPVVYLELESPYFDFEPEDIHPVDSLGTLYTAMRVSDSWGKLTVDKGGCLVSRNYKFLRITAKGHKTEKNRISGEGWNLILNEGWELTEVKQNYFLRKAKSI
jgi:hypothetical protein